MDEATFAALWAEGRALTPEQAVGGPERAASSARAKSALTTPAAPSTPVETGLESSGLPRERSATVAAPLAVAPPSAIPAGLTDAQVAELLVISPRTVNRHLASIYGKLGLHSRTAAARFALDHRLI